MAVPILKQGDVLVASVQESLSDTDFSRFRDDLLERVGRFRARGVVLDLGSLDVLDSFATRMIRMIAEAVRLRGAEAVIVGIQPEVAMAMVEMGLTLPGVHTALDLEDGLGLLRGGADGADNDGR